MVYWWFQSKISANPQEWEELTDPLSLQTQGVNLQGKGALLPQKGQGAGRLTKHRPYRQRENPGLRSLYKQTLIYSTNFLSWTYFPLRCLMNPDTAKPTPPVLSNPNEWIVIFLCKGHVHSLFHFSHRELSFELSHVHVIKYRIFSCYSALCQFY